MIAIYGRCVVDIDRWDVIIVADIGRWDVIIIVDVICFCGGDVIAIYGRCVVDID